ncbi:MAG: putative metal-binding motif-containing protein [Syntrophobacteraceae bacterium]
MGEWRKLGMFGVLILAVAIGVWLGRGLIQPSKTWYKDADEDGFSDGATLEQADRPPGYFLPEELLAVKGDCDDADATVFPKVEGEKNGHPGPVEICDGKDNDCNGEKDDGLGDFCRNFREDVILPEHPVRPGEPIWATARFTNDSGKPVQAIRPDCFNTTFTLLDERGRIVRPWYRIRKAYGIPLDVAALHSEPYTVTCDLAEMFRPEELGSDAGQTPRVYRVQATYSNWIQDPDITASGGCSAPEGKCYALWTGAVGSTSKAQLIVQGDVAERTAVEVRFHPPVWSAAWVSEADRRIKARIEGIDPMKIGLPNPSVSLNGVVPIIEGSAVVVGKTLTVEFDRAKAVSSLGSLVAPLPDFVYPSIDVVTPGLVYSGKAAVEIKQSILADKEKAQ